MGSEQDKTEKETPEKAPDVVLATTDNGDSAVQNCAEEQDFTKSARAVYGKQETSDASPAEDAKPATASKAKPKTTKKNHTKARNTEEDGAKRSSTACKRDGHEPSANADKLEEEKRLAEANAYNAFRKDVETVRVLRTRRRSLALDMTALKIATPVVPAVAFISVLVLLWMTAGPLAGIITSVIIAAILLAIFLKMYYAVDAAVERFNDLEWVEGQFSTYAGKDFFKNVKGLSYDDRFRSFVDIVIAKKSSAENLPEPILPTLDKIKALLDGLNETNPVIWSADTIGLQVMILDVLQDLKMSEVFANVKDINKLVEPVLEDLFASMEKDVDKAAGKDVPETGSLSVTDRIKSSLGKWADMGVEPAKA